MTQKSDRELALEAVIEAYEDMIDALRDPILDMPVFIEDVVPKYYEIQGRIQDAWGAVEAIDGGA